MPIPLAIPIVLGAASAATSLASGLSSASPKKEKTARYNLMDQYAQYDPNSQMMNKEEYTSVAPGSQGWSKGLGIASSILGIGSSVTGAFTGGAGGAAAKGASNVSAPMISKSPDGPNLMQGFEDINPVKQDLTRGMPVKTFAPQLRGVQVEADKQFSALMRNSAESQIGSKQPSLLDNQESNDQATVDSDKNLMQPFSWDKYQKRYEENIMNPIKNY